jgi:hypothetical protein
MRSNCHSGSNELLPVLFDFDVKAQLLANQDYRFRSLAMFSTWNGLLPEAAQACHRVRASRPTLIVPEVRQRDLPAVVQISTQRQPLQ